VLDTHIGNPVEVAVVGDLGSEDARRLLDCVYSAYIPTKVVAAGPPGSLRPALLADRGAAGPADAAAYVCRGFVCSRPVTSVEDLRAELGFSDLAPEGHQAV
jgi:uncharacterized protein